MEVTYNHDVAGLVDRVERIKYELIKSQSANVTETISYDLGRAKMYLDYADSYKAYVVGQPALDLPESSPREIELRDAHPVPEMENPEIRDLIRLFEVLRTEMVHSASSRLGSGLNIFDSGRYDQISGKARKLIEHIENATPVDMPESTPRTPSTGPGRGGV